MKQIKIEKEIRKKAKKVENGCNTHVLCVREYGKEMN
jgi:hypothetical protein